MVDGGVAWIWLGWGRYGMVGGVGWVGYGMLHWNVQLVIVNTCT